VTRVDRRQLDREWPRTTPEALADAAGISVQKTNHGGGSPIVRGMMGNLVLALVDGIRLNNATSRYGPNQGRVTRGSWWCPSRVQCRPRRFTMRRWLAVVMVVAMAAPALAQVRRVDLTMLYMKHCSSCHGLKGEAKPGVPALTGTLEHGSSLGEIETVIRDGVANTTMTPFRGKITDAQIKSLAEMVRDFAPR
jgi:mono/diheme cytochrome c family protein